MTETPAVETPKETKPAKPVYEGPRCAVCNKPLDDPESVKRGIGPLCAAKGWTKEKVAARMAELVVTSVPEGWKKIAELDKFLRTKEIPIARMVRAIGGDRAMEQPINPTFQVVYFGRTRYIAPEAFGDDALKILSDKNLGKPVEPKPAKPPKEPKLDAEGKPIEKKAKKTKVVDPAAFAAAQTVAVKDVESFISDAK